MSEMTNKRFRSIEIISRDNENGDFKEIKKLMQQFPNLRLILLFGSKREEVLFHDITHTRQVLRTKRNIYFRSPTKISYENFIINTYLFTEAQKHHTYFNRKISIDTEGNIKNCPSLNRSFGNIKDTTLQEAIDKPGFKDLWFVRKDDTRICRDCEFRYMCVDSREPLWDEEKQEWYHKIACPYDPYTATWTDLPKEATVI